MRKHLIEQTRTVSLKHIIDLKEREQDLARPVGPVDRAVAAEQCGCWDYERRWAVTNVLMNETSLGANMGPTKERGVWFLEY